MAQELNDDSGSGNSQPYTAAGNVDGDYSAIADSQLDKIEAGGDVPLYNSILDVYQQIFDEAAPARRMSTAITTVDGIVMRLPVRGHAPYKVFWTLPGPRIEAVFPYEAQYAPNLEAGHSAVRAV